MTYSFEKTVEVVLEKPRKFRLERNLVGRKLAESALAGTYYDSKML